MPCHRRPSQWSRAAAVDRPERGTLSVRVDVRGLRWQRNGKTLLDVERLALEGPGLVLLTGPSGAGKSSLLKALTGTLRDFQGGHVDGNVDLVADGGRHARIGYVPQDARDAFLAHTPLFEYRLRLQAIGWRHEAATTEALRLLGRDDLARLASVPIHRLSAGERRRLALFASRIHRPHLLLLDEPLNHLDAHWRATLTNDVCATAEQALVVVATHETRPWETIAMRRIHIEGGSVKDDPADARRSDWTRRPTTPAHRPARLLIEDVVDKRGLLQRAALALPTGLHAIAGPNGAGKSTLLRIIGGLERPEGGSVTFDGRRMHDLPPSVQARFRAHHIEEPRDAFFLDRARDEIGFQPACAGIPAQQTRRRVEAAAARFQLGSLLDRHPLSLSGGEQERVALACTDAARADLLILDEPTNGLDDEGRFALARFLETAAQEACIVVATHDEELLGHCDTIHHIVDRRLVSTKTAITEVRPRASSS